MRSPVPGVILRSVRDVATDQVLKGVKAESDFIMRPVAERKSTEEKPLKNSVFRYPFSYGKKRF